MQSEYEIDMWNVLVTKEKKDNKNIVNRHDIKSLWLQTNNFQESGLEEEQAKE